MIGVPMVRGPQQIDAHTGPDSRRGFLLAIASILLVQMVASLDSGGTNTASRTIQLDFGATLTSIQMVIGGYMLFAAATMMLGARLGDVLGRRRVLVIGAVLRVVGLLVTIVAPNVGILFLGRSVIGGIAAALCLACGSSIISTKFTGEVRTRGFVLIGAAVAIGGMLGPLIAGWASSTVGWRWFYVVLLGLSVLAIALAHRVPHTPPITDRFELDLIGAVMSIIAFGCLVFGIQQSTPWGLFNVRDAPFTVFGLSPAPFVIILGLVLIVVFAYVEHRLRLAGRPVLFDLQLLTDRFVRNGALALLLLASTLFGVTFLVPVYMQVIEGLSPFETGIRFACYGAGALAFSWFVPRLARRFGLRGLLTIGIVASIVASFVLAWEISPLPWGATPIGFAILGIGLALSKSRVSSALQAAVPKSEQGQVSGMGESVWAIGGALGVAVIGTLMLATLAAGAQSLVSADPSITDEARAVAQGHIDSGMSFVPPARVHAILVEDGLPPDQIEILSDHYSDAARSALLLALGGGVAFAAAALVVVRRLPRVDPVAAEPA